MKKINKSAYFGFGIIFAPKSDEYSAGLIINFMFWELNYRWGMSKQDKEQLSQVEILEEQIKEFYGKDAL